MFHNSRLTLTPEELAFRQIDTNVDLSEYELDVRRLSVEPARMSDYHHVLLHGGELAAYGR